MRRLLISACFVAVAGMSFAANAADSPLPDFVSYKCSKWNSDLDSFRQKHEQPIVDQVNATSVFVIGYAQNQFEQLNGKQMIPERTAQRVMEDIEQMCLMLPDSHFIDIARLRVRHVLMKEKGF